MQFPRASNERLMLAPSTNLTPRFWVAAALVPNSQSVRCPPVVRVNFGGGGTAVVRRRNLGDKLKARLPARTGRGRRNVRRNSSPTPFFDGQDKVSLAGRERGGKARNTSFAGCTQYLSEPARSTRLSFPMCIVATVPGALSRLSTTTCRHRRIDRSDFVTSERDS